MRELDTIRLPTPKIAAWFRDALDAAFIDVSQMQAARRKTPAKRRSELSTMQPRLLNGYLNDAIDEGVFTEKSGDLKRQAEKTERQLDETNGFDLAMGQTALAVFDFQPEPRKLVARFKVTRPARHPRMRDFELNPDERKCNARKEKAVRLFSRTAFSVE